MLLAWRVFYKRAFAIIDNYMYKKIYICQGAQRDSVLKLRFVCLVFFAVSTVFQLFNGEYISSILGIR